MYLLLGVRHVFETDLPSSMPSAESGGLENFWYSFDHGSVHFVMLNTETDFPNAPDEPGGEGDENAGPFAPSGAQLAWLEKDLAAVDRKKTPWVGQLATVPGTLARRFALSARLPSSPS